jgi:hypothetical protein
MKYSPRLATINQSHTDGTNCRGTRVCGVWSGENSIRVARACSTLLITRAEFCIPFLSYSYVRVHNASVLEDSSVATISIPSPFPWISWSKAEAVYAHGSPTVTPVQGYVQAEAKEKASSKTYSVQGVVFTPGRCMGNTFATNLSRFLLTHPWKILLQPQACSTPKAPGCFHISSSKLKKMVLAPTFSIMLMMAVFWLSGPGVALPLAWPACGHPDSRLYTSFPGQI